MGIHVLYGQGVALDERMLPFPIRYASTMLTPLEAPPFPSFVHGNAAIDLAARCGFLPNGDLHAPLAP